MMKKTIPVFMIFCVALFASQACYGTKTGVQQKAAYRVNDGKTVSFGEMIDEIKTAQVVFVGESHDQSTHHQLQLEVIRALQREGKPLAVGFEMFTARSQPVLDRWVSGQMPQDEFIRAYYENWTFPWPLYRDILLFVKEHRIPAVGLNVEPSITRKVAQSGFASLTKEELATLPPDVGCAVDKEYMDFVRRAHAMHGHGNRNFVFFCQAQLLWDQVMARNIVGFLKNNPERTIVVITGNGHAWKRGIPEQVRLLSSSVTYRVLLPMMPGHIDSSSISTGDADYILTP